MERRGHLPLGLKAPDCSHSLYQAGVLGVLQSTSRHLSLVCWSSALMAVAESWLQGLLNTTWDKLLKYRFLMLHGNYNY